MINRKKGQSIIEFAIVIPFFLIFVLGVLFLAIYFYNLIALQTMSRDIARAMSVGNNYSSIQSDYKNGTMPNLLIQGYYTWKPESPYFPEPAVGDTDVTVKLTAQGNSNYTGLITPVLGAGSVFTSISVSTSMYKEST